MQGRDLMPAERQKEILERIRKDGRVLATDLAREFSTSEDTIRRALRDLARSRLVRSRLWGSPRHLSSRLGDHPSAKKGGC